VKPESVEEEEMTRVPRIWGYASGGVIGLSGILAIFWWMRAVVLFGLLFWGMFSVGFLIQVGGGIKWPGIWYGDLRCVLDYRHHYFIWILLNSKRIAALSFLSHIVCLKTTQNLLFFKTLARLEVNLSLLGSDSLTDLIFLPK